MNHISKTNNQFLKLKGLSDIINSERSITDKLVDDKNDV